jgi:GNAT superfamily N-acetyltransferase
VTIRIERVPASVTWPLRQAVLRPHQSIEQLQLPSDDLLTTACFAAFGDDGEVVGTSQVALEEAPFRASEIGNDVNPAWRLRGMATQEDFRGSGVGTALLNQVIDYVAEWKGAVLWCNARLAAINLYLRLDFQTYGDPWQDPDIGAHVVMWRAMSSE